MSSFSFSSCFATNNNFNSLSSSSSFTSFSSQFSLFTSSCSSFSLLNREISFDFSWSFRCGICSRVSSLLLCHRCSLLRLEKYKRKKNLDAKKVKLANLKSEITKIIREETKKNLCSSDVPMHFISNSHEYKNIINKTNIDFEKNLKLKKIEKKKILLARISYLNCILRQKKDSLNTLLKELKALHLFFEFCCNFVQFLEKTIQIFNKKKNSKKTNFSLQAFLQNPALHTEGLGAFHIFQELYAKMECLKSERSKKCKSFINLFFDRKNSMEIFTALRSLLKFQNVSSYKNEKEVFIEAEAEVGTASKIVYTLAVILDIPLSYPIIIGSLHSFFFASTFFSSSVSLTPFHCLTSSAASIASSFSSVSASFPSSFNFHRKRKKEQKNGLVGGIKPNGAVLHSSSRFIDNSGFSDRLSSLPSSRAAVFSMCPQSLSPSSCDISLSSYPNQLFFSSVSSFPEEEDIGFIEEWGGIEEEEEKDSSKDCSFASSMKRATVESNKDKFFDETSLFPRRVISCFTDFEKQQNIASNLVTQIGRRISSKFNNNKISLFSCANLSTGNSCFARNNVQLCSFSSCFSSSCLIHNSSFYPPSTVSSSFSCRNLFSFPSTSLSFSSSFFYSSAQIASCNKAIISRIQIDENTDIIKTCSFHDSSYKNYLTSFIHPSSLAFPTHFAYSSSTNNTPANDNFLNNEINSPCITQTHSPFHLSLAGRITNPFTAKILHTATGTILPLSTIEGINSSNKIYVLNKWIYMLHKNMCTICERNGVYVQQNKNYFDDFINLIFMLIKSPFLGSMSVVPRFNFSSSSSSFPEFSMSSFPECFFDNEWMMIDLDEPSGWSEDEKEGKERKERKKEKEKCIVSKKASENLYAVKNKSIFLKNTRMKRKVEERINRKASHFFTVSNCHFCKKSSPVFCCASTLFQEEEANEFFTNVSSITPPFLPFGTSFQYERVFPISSGHKKTRKVNKEFCKKKEKKPERVQSKQNQKFDLLEKYCTEQNTKKMVENLETEKREETLKKGKARKDMNDSSLSSFMPSFFSPRRRGSIAGVALEGIKNIYNNIYNRKRTILNQSDSPVDSTISFPSLYFERR